VKQHFCPVPYNQQFEPLPGVTARLVDAGHILGSAAVVLDVEEKGRKSRLWFSGDIGRERLPLLQDPVLPSGANTLLMECTTEISLTAIRIWPSPSLARRSCAPSSGGQSDRRRPCRWPRPGISILPAPDGPSGPAQAHPVYVDSPLAVAASRVFINHPSTLTTKRKNSSSITATSAELCRTHLHPERGGKQRAQRPARSDGDHRGFRYAENRAHPAPPAQ